MKKWRIAYALLLLGSGNLQAEGVFTAAGGGVVAYCGAEVEGDSSNGFACLARSPGKAWAHPTVDGVTWITGQIDGRLQTAISVRDKQIGDLKSEIAVLKTNLKSMSTTNDALTKRIDDLESRLTKAKIN